MKLTYATTNPIKLAVATGILNTYGIEVISAAIETPELQSFSGQEVCEYSPRYAAKQLGKEVVKGDVSYSIPALNGFPGPFVKYINTWLTAKDLLALMNGKDRTIVTTEYVTYAKPDGTIKTFCGQSTGTLSDKIYSNNGSMFDKLHIREGYTVPQNTLTQQELLDFFIQNQTAWHELARYLKEE